ncbi:hypothetical protein GALMADRAFT_212967 [Galerina marginata CBS 339.88]|uniref:DUF6534 domain-containing protein n=1 Tax=Galerina marginata (strain CBS 339.88) TaxID=685588 RepID=A0A067SZB4_GALM3|nr:hypothetical protein GALMADRAFT_212967 [Galerina marginata CBS 339.88]
MASAPVLDVPNTFGIFLSDTYWIILCLHALWSDHAAGVGRMVNAFPFDILFAALRMFTLYYYLIANYNNPSAMLIGHCYFVVRIFYLSPKKLKWWITSVIGVTVIAHLAFGMETVVLMFIKKELSKLSELDLYPALQFAILCVLSDLLIAGTLIYLLRGHRSGIRKTDNLVATLIVYAVNRFLLTSIVEIAELIAALVLPRSLWFIGIDFIIGKLYANSLLASLNSRAGLGNRSGSTVNSVHLSALNFQESDEEQAEVCRWWYDLGQQGNFEVDFYTLHNR